MMTNSILYQQFKIIVVGRGNPLRISLIYWHSENDMWITWWLKNEKIMIIIKWNKMMKTYNGWYQYQQVLTDSPVSGKSNCFRPEIKLHCWAEMKDRHRSPKDWHGRDAAGDHLLGSVSISDETSYRKNSWNLEAARLAVQTVASLWNWTGKIGAIELF